MGFTLSPAARELIQSTFFGKDYTTYRQEIIDAINAVFGEPVATNIVASEQGVFLIELFAFGLSMLSWYGDRQADDTTLRYARLRFAAVTIARQLGYKAGAAVPPVVDVRVQLTTVPPVQLVIKKGQKAAGPDGLIFETIADLVFDTGQIGSGLPAGMLVNSLVVNPVTPSTIYAGTSTGILKTANSGLLWSAQNSGLTTLNVTTLAMDPTNPLILYAGTNVGGIFKTVNGGSSWSAVNVGLSNLKILSIAIHPITPAIIYAGTNSGGVFKSINSGASWTAVNGGLTDFVIQSLVIDPLTPTTVYAGSFSLGVFKTTNSGVTWSASSTGLGTLDVKAIAINPTTTSTLYLCTNGGGVYKTTTSGASWAPSNSGLTSNIPTCIVIDPSSPNTVYIGTNETGVFKTTTGGTTWLSASAGLTTTAVTSISLDPTTPAKLYAGTNGGGVFGSTNSATTWSALNVGIDDPIKTVSMREGLTLEEVFRSAGTPNQFFQLATIPAGKSIAQDTPTTTVAGILWPEVPLLTYDQTNQVEIDYGLNPPRIVFGDGIAGNIPQKDAEVRVNFFVTSGSNGAIASNTITSFIGPIVAGTTPIGTTLSNSAPSTPGSNVESIDSIKVNAPLVFQAAQRSVTKKDLDGWINSFTDPTFGKVAKGRAVAPRSAAEDAEAQTIIGMLAAFGLPASFVTRVSSYFDKILSSHCEANSVLIQILSADGIGRYVAAPGGLVQGLETFIDAISESTVSPVVTDGSVNLLSVTLTVGVKVEADITSEVLRTAIRDSVRNTLQTMLIGRDFGASLRIGDIYQNIENIDGVDYSHVSIVVRNNFNDDVSATRLDEFGDLAIEDFEVITMGDTPDVSLI